ncbi:MAG: hypothetical protein ACYSVY_02655 [Planctomycetota bacterium]|jgi:hypothetical protein
MGAPRRENVLTTSDADPGEASPRALELSRRPAKGAFSSGCVYFLITGLADVRTGETETRRGHTAREGDVTTLRTDDSGPVPVAASKADYDRFSELCRANDLTGIDQMMLVGRVWTVPSGTECRVISRSWGTYEVRILDGLFAGQSCFVSYHFVADVGP